MAATHGVIFSSDEETSSYFVKGWVCKKEFQAEVEGELGREINIADIRHSYCRWIWGSDSGERKSLLVKSNGNHKRGTFKVTICRI